MKDFPEFIYLSLYLSISYLSFYISIFYISIYHSSNYLKATDLKQSLWKTFPNAVHPSSVRGRRQASQFPGKSLYCLLVFRQYHTYIITEEKTQGEEKVRCLGQHMAADNPLSCPMSLFYLHGRHRCSPYVRQTSNLFHFGFLPQVVKYSFLGQFLQV